MLYIYIYIYIDKRLHSTRGNFVIGFAGFDFSVNVLVMIFDCIGVCP